MFMIIVMNEDGPESTPSGFESTPSGPESTPSGPEFTPPGPESILLLSNIPECRPTFPECCPMFPNAAFADNQLPAMASISDEIKI
jgi:hypothetical protein